MKVLAYAACLLMAGCATVPIPDARSGFCSLTSPILVKCEGTNCLSKSGLDSFSAETAREIEEHNQKGKALCGWKPTKGGK